MHFLPCFISFEEFVSGTYGWPHFLASSTRSISSRLKAYSDQDAAGGPTFPRPAELSLSGKGRAGVSSTKLIGCIKPGNHGLIEPFSRLLVVGQHVLQTEMCEQAALTVSAVCAASLADSSDAFLCLFAFLFLLFFGLSIQR